MKAKNENSIPKEKISFEIPADLPASARKRLLERLQSSLRSEIGDIYTEEQINAKAEAAKQRLTEKLTAMFGFKVEVTEVDLDDKEASMFLPRKDMKKFFIMLIQKNLIDADELESMLYDNGFFIKVGGYEVQFEEL